MSVYTFRQRLFRRTRSSTIRRINRGTTELFQHQLKNLVFLVVARRNPIGQSVGTALRLLEEERLRR